MTTTPDLVTSLYERWGAAFGAEPEMPLDRWRALIEEWPQVTAEPGGVDYVGVQAGGVPAMWIAPKAAADDRVILSMHGGGFATGSMYTHRKLFGHLAKAVGARGLVDDSRAFAERAREAGVDGRLDIFPGHQHTFQMAAGRSPDADEAIRRLADWVRPHLGL
jgi:acetyl esterase/lipase